MVIDKDSLQALNIAINDWDDNNRSSEDYEENRLRLEEIYSVIHRKVEHSKTQNTHLITLKTWYVRTVAPMNGTSTYPITTAIVVGGTAK